MGIYGIDLGTTYSCITKLDDNGNPVVIKNFDDGVDTLASAVYFERDSDNVVIGAAAKDYEETDGVRGVQFVKREIGKPNAQIREFDGKMFSPVEISALILGRLKQIAEDQGEIVEDVVITCPAYFGFEERNATRQAGELVGLNVRDLLNEPTAAALSYCARQFQEEKTVLVYDLGGGTFDVSIVRMGLETDQDGNEAQTIKIVATGGNDLLGGKDWDDRLFDYMVSMCCDDNGLAEEDLTPETRQVIRSKVEETKKKLTNRESVRIRIPVNDMSTQINITREDFENMTADKVAQTMQYVEDTLQKAGNIDIDIVLLVGGSTFMPMIRKAVEERFPGKVQLEDPNLAVAKGAVIYANMIVHESNGSQIDPPIPGTTPEPGSQGGNEGGHGGGFGGGIGIAKPQELLPRSFGPGVRDEAGSYIVDNLLKYGDSMPATMEKTYFTVEDNMEKIVLRAFENFSVEDRITPCVDMEGNDQPSNPADQVKLLGELELRLPPNTPRMSPIDVTFSVLDSKGIYIKAVNQATGESVEATLHMESDIDMEHSAVTSMCIMAD